MATARRYYRKRFGRPPTDDRFYHSIPEELVGEMLTDLWERKDELTALLTDPDWMGDRNAVSAELADLEESLGLRREGDPVSTGWALEDYLLARTKDGSITPEDLDLTPEEFDRMVKRRGR